MPSPPDVILVLSPRMAKLVAEAIESYHYTPPTADEWSGAGEWTKALNDTVIEIADQLSRERVEYETALSGGRYVVVPTRGKDSDAARIADKMAKAARAAVEPKAEDMGTADGIPQEPLLSEQDLADLAAEGERNPGIAPPDSEVQ